MVPYLRKFGKATIPDFIGDRYYSDAARLVAVICAIFICMTYIMGQMRGVGIVFSRLFDIEIWMGVIIGAGIVFFYAGLGGMKGITYTQVAQYCVMVFAYTIPVFFISLIITGNAIPQFGLVGDYVKDGAENAVPLIDKINQISTDLGFSKYTENTSNTLDLFCITAALDGGNRRITPCDCPLLYCKKCQSSKKIRLLDAKLHCYHISDSPGPWYVCPDQFYRGD